MRPGIEHEIPNLPRFMQAHPRSTHFLRKALERYERLPDGPEKKRAADWLNLRLGTALLRQSEIDRKAYGQILSVLSKE